MKTIYSSITGENRIDQTEDGKTIAVAVFTNTYIKHAVVLDVTGEDEPIKAMQKELDKLLEPRYMAVLQNKVGYVYFFCAEPRGVFVHYKKAM